MEIYFNNDKQNTFKLQKQSYESQFMIRDSQLMIEVCFLIEGLSARDFYNYIKKIQTITLQETAEEVDNPFPLELDTPYNVKIKTLEYWHILDQTVYITLIILDEPEDIDR